MYLLVSFISLSVRIRNTQVQDLYIFMVLIDMCRELGVLTASTLLIRWRNWIHVNTRSVVRVCSFKVSAYLYKMGMFNLLIVISRKTGHVDG